MDLSAIAKSIQDCEQASKRPRYLPLPDGSFPAASLRAWLSIAQCCGVPHVPAQYEAALPIEPLLRFDAPIEGTQEVLAALQYLNEKVEDGRMLRWDCCAPWGVKCAMGNGFKQPSRSEMALDPGDPRAFDLIYDFPAEDIEVFSRPWVHAMMFEDFPVEFRVFIEEGKVVGVSNYYPQRALPDHPRIRQMVSEITRYAQRMVQKAKDRDLRPWMPRVAAAHQPSFSATLDFLVLSSARVVLLEGGPGFGFGAHPCCFAKHLHGMTGANEIRGLCLSVGKEAIALPGLD